MLTLYPLATFVPPPTLLEIEVKTARALVLRGARKLLAKHRRIVGCEISNGDRAEVTWELRSQSVPPARPRPEVPWAGRVGNLDDLGAAGFGSMNMWLIAAFHKVQQ